LLIGHQHAAVCRVEDHAGRYVVVTNEQFIGCTACAEQVDLQLVGPPRRTIGSRAEFTVDVKNTTETPIDDVTVSLSYDRTLELQEVTEGADRKPGVLRWDLGTLKAGEQVQLQAEFTCSRETEQACLIAKVAGADLPDEKVESCLRVIPVRGVLDMRISDSVDPVQPDKTTDFVVTVKNRGLQTARDIRLFAEVPRLFRVAAVEVHREDKQLNPLFEVKGARVLFDAVPELDPNAVLTYTIRLKAVKAGRGELVSQVKYAAKGASTELREPIQVGDR